MNFLRFSKARGFKEFSFQGLVRGVEDTYSEYFLGQLRKQLLIKDDKLTKDFMNVFYNCLNDLTTELFVIFKELKNHFT